MLAGKMILFFEYREKIGDLVYNAYKQSIQKYLSNEDRVRDYLGYRQDDDMIRVNLILVDRDYASLFRRKLSCELGVGLLQTDEEQSTEEYDSAEDECDTLDELCC